MKLARTLVPLVLSGCSILIGGRPDTCGEYPPGGGPAVIATRDQELCEVVRLRVVRQLAALDDLTRDRIDALVECSLVWEQKSTIEALIAAIRKDAGDGMADDVSRAVESVAAHSQRPMRAECAADERCMVKGAALGARMALLYAQPTKRTANEDARGSEPR